MKADPTENKPKMLEAARDILIGSGHELGGAWRSWGSRCPGEHALPCSPEKARKNLGTRQCLIKLSTLWEDFLLACAGTDVAIFRTEQ